MAIRRLNWTDRQRISREDARLTIHRDNGTESFSAELRLLAYALPLDAQVVVEAYRQTTWARYAFGTVGAPRRPPDLSLAEFGDVEGLLFRVKVLGVGAAEGRILAEADQLRPVDPSKDGSRESLLDPQGRDLDSQAWKLEFDEPGGPQFFVNNRLGDWRSVARSAEFIWFVYPEVLRQIVARALRERPEDEDRDSWQSKWLRFAEQLPGVTGRPEEHASESEQQDWADEAVNAFCRHNRLFDRFGQMLIGGSDQ